MPETVYGVPVMPTGPGYTFDPYAGEENSKFFIGTFISKFTGDPDGFLSNYREWHILLEGICAGLKAPTFENVPNCPPLWGDEPQYFNTPAMIANVVKCQWPSISVAVAAITTKVVGVW